MHPDLKNIGVACSPFGLGRCSREHGKQSGMFEKLTTLTSTTSRATFTIRNTTLRFLGQLSQYKLQPENPDFPSSRREFSTESGLDRQWLVQKHLSGQLHVCTQSYIFPEYLIKNIADKVCVRKP